MRRPLLAFIGLIAAGGTAAGVYVALPGGGEEEVLQQPTTATAGPTSSETPAETAVKSPTPSTAVIPDDWLMYTDPVLGFSFPHPPGVMKDIDPVALSSVDNAPTVEMRFVSFTNSDGVPTVGASITPNPAGLALQDWISAYPGWPCDPVGYPTCDPTELILDGQPAIWFSIDTLGEPSATVYVAEKGFIYSLSGNVFGSGQAGYAPTVSEREFQAWLKQFRFPE